jgi:hypothetical protein
VRGPSDPYRSGGGGGYDGRDENGQGNHRDRADNSAYGGHGY